MLPSSNWRETTGLRRAERLFQIIQILRRARAPVTASAIAEELETSVRTIYRDIAELLAQRVPVRGEAGIGYLMDKGFDLPPLMLTPDEIEAAVLGAQWVAGRADPELARAARDLVAKIGAVIPSHLRPFLMDATTTTAGRPNIMPDALDIGRLRGWIRAQKKLDLVYRDEEGATSKRTVWPIAIGYYDTVRVIAAWCELRQDFRHFRTDRVVAADFVEERYPGRREALRAAWRKGMTERPRWPRPLPPATS
jgi:predicted DNA-binding transcriptional regulator YafY